MIDKLQSEKKEIFLYLMYVYQQIVKADIEYLENSRVTEITHDWLNFGYEFVSSRSASIASQKDCIKLLKINKNESGSRVYLPELNNAVKRELNISSQVIKDLVQANFNVQSRLNNGYKYWVDLGWKETEKRIFIIIQAKIISFHSIRAKM